MNDIKKTALKETVKTVAGLTLISLAVPAVLFTVPLEALITVAMIFMLGFAVKMIYDTKLNQIEYRAKLEEMTKNNPTLR
jgi:hypothetical protein